VWGVKFKVVCRVNFRVLGQVEKFRVRQLACRPG
jgi:hypothetical protein